MPTLTLTGENNDTITLNNSSQSTSSLATDLVNDLNSKIANGTAVINNVNDGGVQSNDSNKDVIYYLTKDNSNSNLWVTKNIKYFVIGDNSQSTNEGPITLHTENSSLTPNDNLTVLSGRNSVVNFYTNKAAGHFINTAGTLNFQATNTTANQGDWVIDSGNGNDTINAGNGFNTINAGLGNNIIKVGSGNNTINSTGQDTITAADGGSNSVTLWGGSSQVTSQGMSVVVSASSDNKISVGHDSTVSGGTNSTVTFDQGSRSELQAVNNNTVSGINNVNLVVVQGGQNTLNIDGSMTFYNGTGITNTTLSGSGALFGANELNFVLNSPSSTNSTITGSTYFVAGNGNETLDASNYNNHLEIYANTISGSSSNFIAIGTKGDDVLAAGVGNSTFTGGQGNNNFMFNENGDANGNTVITDFSKSAGNKISLINYGLNDNSLTQLLHNAQNNQNGDAVLNLSNHTITLEGVSVSNLNNNQFNIINQNNTTAI